MNDVIEGIEGVTYPVSTRWDSDEYCLALTC